MYVVHDTHGHTYCLARLNIQSDVAQCIGANIARRLSSGGVDVGVFYFPHTNIVGQSDKFVGGSTWYPVGTLEQPSADQHKHQPRARLRFGQNASRYDEVAMTAYSKCI